MDNLTTSESTKMVINYLAKELNVSKKKARELFNQSITVDWVRSAIFQHSHWLLTGKDWDDEDECD